MSEEIITITRLAIRELDQKLGKLNKNNKKKREELTAQKEALMSELPVQLSEDELTSILQEYSVEIAGFNIGKAMKYLRSNFHGMYDAKMANNIAGYLA